MGQTSTTAWMNDSHFPMGEMGLSSGCESSLSSPESFLLCFLPPERQIRTSLYSTVTEVLISRRINLNICLFWVFLTFAVLKRLPPLTMFQQIQARILTSTVWQCIWICEFTLTLLGLVWIFLKFFTKSRSVQIEFWFWNFKNLMNFLLGNCPQHTYGRYTEKTSRSSI